MTNSLELLDKALKAHTSQAELARSLHVSPAALSQARARGRLSPSLAGALAKELGQPVAEWVAVAAIEAEPPSKARDTVKKALQAMRNFLHRHSSQAASKGLAGWIRGYPRAAQ